MKSLFTKDDFDMAKGRDLFDLECVFCAQKFKLTKKEIRDAAKCKQGSSFCSSKCFYKSLITRQKVSCVKCGKLFEKKLKEIKKSKNHFCCKSHAAIWNNAHKTKGTRVSKLEKWLAVKLIDLYPNLEIHFSKTDVINAELDIYIPQFRLAFELNGIFHYEPIYGSKKLLQTKTNDTRKMQACFEHGIEICIIDVSQQKYFKEQTSIKFLEIIKKIVDVKMAEVTGVEPIKPF